MRRLPLEIEHLILQELEGQQDELCNCSLVCKSWHEFCLPALFYELAIIVDVDGRRHLPACSSLLTDSPHLRQYVRKFTLECEKFPIFVDDHEERMIESILLGLPRLDELLCFSIPPATLSSVLPQLSITKLHLKNDPSSPLALLPVLEAVASTVRSLTLEELIFGDEFTMDDFATQISNEPICMTALQELALICCVNLPLTSKLIRMPNLTTLYCEGEGVALGDGVPSSLKTLIVADAKAADNFKPLSVDNVCIRWWDTNTHHRIGHIKLTDTVERVINTFVVPSKIKHIEILLDWSSNVTFSGRRVKLDRLEECLLDLHRSGSFERLTITAEEDDQAMSPKSITDKFPNMSSLGLLDVRMGLPSVQYPRCTTL